MTHTLPIDRIHEVAHLLPIHILEDINKRMSDWKSMGGNDDDPYMHQQARYAEMVATQLSKRK